MNSIRLSNTSGQIFEASDYISTDIIEETEDVDSLNGNTNPQEAEATSERLDQEELIILCEEVRAKMLLGTNCEDDIKILSAHGFECPGFNPMPAPTEEVAIDNAIEEEVKADDALPIISSSKYMSVEELMDLRIARERTSKHISKFRS